MPLLAVKKFLDEFLLQRRNADTRSLDVVPRTSESSTTTKRLPSMTVLTGFNFNLTPNFEFFVWLNKGASNVVVSQSELNGKPDSSAYPMLRYYLNQESQSPCLHQQALAWPGRPISFLA